MFIDIVIPKGNEQEFIEIAEKLGCSGLIFLYTKEDRDISEKIKELKNRNKLKIMSGFLVKDPNKARRARKDFDLLFGLGTRENFESRDIDVLFDLESGPRQDYIHNRNSGLNQVHCKLAKEKKQIIAVSFSQVLNSDHPEIIIGRLMQNLFLCKKYKNDFIIASFAEHPYEMRYSKDYVAFLKAVGAHNKQAKDAVEILSRFFL